MSAKFSAFILLAEVTIIKGDKVISEFSVVMNCLPNVNRILLWHFCLCGLNYQLNKNHFSGASGFIVMSHAAFYNIDALVTETEEEGFLAETV